MALPPFLAKTTAPPLRGVCGTYRSRRQMTDERPEVRSDAAANEPVRHSTFSVSYRRGQILFPLASHSSTVKDLAV